MSGSKKNLTRTPLSGKTTGKPKQSSIVNMSNLIKNHVSLERYLSTPGSRTVMREVLGITDPDKIYVIRQTAFLLYQQSSIANAFFALAPTLGSFSNATSFTSLFDQYRLRKLTFHFIPIQNAVGVNTNSLSSYPYIAVAGDYDDATNWSTLTQAYSYENVKIYPTYKEFTYDVVPHVVITATGGGAVNVGNEWVDTATPNQPWYGLKGAVAAGAAASQYHGWNILVHADIEFRNVI